MRQPWFITPQPRPSAPLRLFCFPYAGMGASAYRPWAAELPADVELCAVQPPGRETRMREPAFADLSQLAAAIGEHILPLLDRPFVFFGHSMGALTAFEVARRLARSGGATPAYLIASAHQAPRLPRRESPLHELPDAAFVAEIQRRYGGIPDEVLAHRELLELLLPGLRADMTAIERYEYQPGEPLGCPILAIGGTFDARVSVADLEAWRDETTAEFSTRRLHGGHFFIQNARAQVIDILATALGPSLVHSPVARVGA
jgi:medium-chain acyl-[acyl-carrier-protein] hydrolase